jgi:hypothetical protein
MRALTGAPVLIPRAVERTAARWLLAAAFWTLPFGCDDVEIPEPPTSSMDLANTLPGHADVLVSDRYASGLEDYWCAALAGLQGGRFALAWRQHGTNRTLYARRYGVAEGGFLGSAWAMDNRVWNVRNAGMTLSPPLARSSVETRSGEAVDTRDVTGGGGSADDDRLTPTGTAWLTWDYHPTDTSWTVNVGRIQYDGATSLMLDVATDAAAPAGAKGTTGGIWPEDRILIAYVAGSIAKLPQLSVEDGDQVRVLLYRTDGTLAAGPVIVDSEPGTRFASPSAVWNSHASRFEITYQQVYPPGSMPRSWFRVKYVLPNGTPETSRRTIEECAWEIKGDGDGDAGRDTRTGPECHRHAVAFDTLLSRNTTRVFAFGYYGQLRIYDQGWNRIRSEWLGGTSHLDVASASPATRYSYQAFSGAQGTDFLNPKFYDDVGGPFDADPVGWRPCRDPGSTRGFCYSPEAVSSSGGYTGVLHVDTDGPDPDPLFLTILDAS